MTAIGLSFTAGVSAGYEGGSESNLWPASEPPATAIDLAGRRLVMPGQ